MSRKLVFHSSITGPVSTGYLTAGTGMQGALNWGDPTLPLTLYRASTPDDGAGRQQVAVMLRFGGTRLVSSVTLDVEATHTTGTTMPVAAYAKLNPALNGAGGTSVATTYTGRPTTLAAGSSWRGTVALNITTPRTAKDLAVIIACVDGTANDQASVTIHDIISITYADAAPETCTVTAAVDPVQEPAQSVMLAFDPPIYPPSLSATLTGPGLDPVALDTSGIATTPNTGASGPVGWSVGGGSLSAPGLSAGTYTATISGEDVYGAPLSASTLQVTVDAAPPPPPPAGLVVAEAHPAASATVYPDQVTPISVVFDQDIDPATVTSATIWLTRGSTTIPTTPSVSGSVVTLTPAAPLTPGSYTVHIPGQA